MVGIDSTQKKETQGQMDRKNRMEFGQEQSRAQRNEKLKKE